MSISNNKSSGYSVIEIMAVIVIVAISGMIARPSLSKVIESFRLRSAANTIKQQLNLAKTRALGDPNVHAGVFLDTAGARDSTIVFLDDDASSMNDNQYSKGKDHLLMPPFVLPRSDTLRIVSGYPAAIIFRGDGSAKAGAKFFIKNKYDKYDTLSVLASTGRIKVVRN